MIKWEKMVCTTKEEPLTPAKNRYQKRRVRKASRGVHTLRAQEGSIVTTLIFFLEAPFLQDNKPFSCCVSPLRGSFAKIKLAGKTRKTKTNVTSMVLPIRERTEPYWP